MKIPEKVSPELQHILAVVIVASGMLISILLIVPKALGIWNATREAAAHRQEAEEKRQQGLMEMARRQPERLAALPESNDEQLALLKEFHQIVAASQVQLVSYRPPSPTPGSSASQPALEASPLGGRLLIPIASDVTVSGSYDRLALFFQRLTTRDRLFTVKNLQMKPETYPQLSASFRLVRYVTPVRFKGTTPAPGAGGATARASASGPSAPG